MRSARHRRDPLQLRRTDNVDSTVLTVLETEDLEPGDDPVLDDPIEIAADRLIGALRPHPRHDSDLAILGTTPNALLQRFEVAAGERDLGQMECRHIPVVAN